MYVKQPTPLFSPAGRRALGMAGMAVLLAMAGCADMSGIDPMPNCASPAAWGCQSPPLRWRCPAR